MLQNYIQLLKELYEKLSQQNINTPTDILTAWKLTAQIMLATIVPICMLVVIVVAHFYIYKFIIHRFCFERDAGDNVGFYITAGYILFTLFVVTPFAAPVVLYFL